MEISLDHIEIAVPNNCVTTEEILSKLSHKMSDNLIETIQGLMVDQRYSIVNGYADYLDSPIIRELIDTTTSLAKKATFKVIENSKVKPEDIGFFIAITNTPDRLMPCMAYEIVAESGNLLPRDICVANMQSQGCSTLLKALELAKYYIKSNPTKCVVIVASEGHTGYTQMLQNPLYRSLIEIKEGDDPRLIEETKVLIASFLFGDGAVAMIIKNSEKGAITFDDIVHLSNISPGDAELLTMNQGGIIEPYFTEVPHYYMSKNVPRKGAVYSKYLVEHLKDCVKEKNMNLGNLSNYFIHTGSRKIIDGVCSILQVEDSLNQAFQSYEILRKYGNLSACSIGFMMHDFLKKKPRKKTKSSVSVPNYGVMVSFGVGFSGSAGIIRIKDA